MAEARFEKLDHSDLANAIRTEQDKAKAPKAAPAGIPGLDVAEHLLGRIRASRASVEALDAEAQVGVSRIDERLKDSIRAQLAGEIRKGAADTSDSALKAMRADLEDLRDLKAIHYEPEVLRRRTRFHTDPVQDATVRTAHLARLAAVPDRVRQVAVVELLKSCLRHG